MALTKMYGDLASWWPLLSPPEEYEEEAGIYQRLLLEACRRPARTLLELGSGGGNNASHLKARFALTLVDPAPGMLAHSRLLNPECEHIEGDMRTLRLDRRFDCVFIHDAIAYMTTLADLRRALETAFFHCEPGGAALFAPDCVRETFRPVTDCGGHDGPGRAMRYLEWTWDPDPADQIYTVEYGFLLREPDGTVTAHHDRHVEGLFARADWLRLIADVGFEATVVPVRHTDIEGDYELFIGRRSET